MSDHGNQAASGRGWGTVPATLEGLIELRRIEEVMYEYCDAVDEMRIDELLEIFSPDCQYDIGLGTVLKGRDDVREWLMDRLTPAIFTSHHVSNIRIRLVGDDRATATSSVYARSSRPDFHSDLWGRYDDVLVKAQGQWLIDRRKLRAAGYEQTLLPSGAASAPFELIERVGRS
jgi:uncharacterized protein (TIGR02246 family)